MARSSTFTLALAGLLVCPAAAAAQQWVTAPVPLNQPVSYTAETQEDAQATPTIYLDQRAFTVVSKMCGAEPVDVACVVIPEAAFYDAVNKAPFPHFLDATLTNTLGVSKKASELLVTPVPAPEVCNYVTKDGQVVPKAVGDDSVWGWNEIETVFDATRGVRVPTLAGIRATYQREQQLRSYGLDYRQYATDDGAHVFKDGKLRILVYAPCTAAAIEAAAITDR